MQSETGPFTLLPVSDLTLAGSFLVKFSPGRVYAVTISMKSDKN